MRGVTRALVAPVWRALPWRVLGAGGAVGLLLAGLPRLFYGDLNGWQALNLLRATALAGALGLAFLLDDPARHLTTPVPTRRALRQALRVGLVAPAVAVWWTTALLLVPAELRPPIADITLEAAATVALALAAAGAGVRFTQEPEPGPAAAAGLLVAAVLGPLLVPGRWALVVDVADARWGAAHERWGVLLVGAVAVWGVCAAERGVRLRAAGA